MKKSTKTTNKNVLPLAERHATNPWLLHFIGTYDEDVVSTVLEFTLLLQSIVKAAKLQRARKCDPDCVISGQ
jgi:hypothetical protein